MAIHRTRSLRTYLLRFSLAALAVFVGSVAVGEIAAQRAFDAWETSVAARAASIVARLLEEEVAESAEDVIERAYMSEPAGVVSGRNVEMWRRRLAEEETHYLAARGYTMLVIADQSRRVVYSWSDSGANAQAPTLPKALFDRLDNGKPLSGFLGMGGGVSLVGASRLLRSDGTPGDGYFVLGRPLDNAFLSRIDPDPEMRLDLRMQPLTARTPEREVTGDSTILRHPIVDLFGTRLATVEAGFARDAQRRLVEWGIVGFTTLLVAGALILLLLWWSAERLLVKPIRLAIEEIDSMRDGRAIRPLQARLAVSEWELLRETFNRAVTSLSEFQRRYRDVFDRAADALFLLEPGSGRVVDANPATAALTGVSAAEIIGQPLPKELVPMGEGQRMVRWRRADGVTQTWGVAASTITFDGGPLTLAAYRDLTGREAMAHAQKMEAVGSLAGGIAHDFNNLMGAVLTGARAARTLIGAGHPSLAAIDAIEHAGTRAADLTRQLLNFSRHDPLRLEPVDIGTCIATVGAICSRTFDPRIVVDAWAAADLPEVLGDAGEIEQALLNLSINARDAMPRGGSLRIEAQRVFIDAAQARTEGVSQPGTFVEVAVADTGEGMSEEVKSRLFEPFFTTKEPGRGTGLGLSLVYAITRQLGGSITVQSTVGRGTRVRLLFPALAQRAERPPVPVVNQVPARPTPAAIDRPVVLLVDDERALREMLRMVLDLSGFSVLEAADGTRALAQFGAHHDAIRAILLDVQLPGELSGVETFERIRALDPDVPVLLCTGFVREEDLARMRRLTVDDVLLKPIDINAMLARLDTLCGLSRAPSAT